MQLAFGSISEILWQFWQFSSIKLSFYRDYNKDQAR